MGTSRWFIERISKTHERDSFDCGNGRLNDFLESFAQEHDRKEISRTYVAVRPGDPAIKGYYTVRNRHVEIRDLPEEVKRGLPRYPVPVVHLARLAVSEDAQGSGLGACLLVSALQLALAVSGKIDAHAVEVVAKDDRARTFYEKYGFKGLPQDRLYLYLPMPVLKRLSP